MKFMDQNGWVTIQGAESSRQEIWMGSQPDEKPTVMELVLCLSGSYAVISI
jgi:hypothetical protein